MNRSVGIQPTEETLSIQKLTIHSSSEETSLFCPACGTWC